jgi:holo-[acyl-carrier protein] synthase
MIVGIGIDHVQTKEFSDLMEQDPTGFLARVFTPVEIAAGGPRNDRVHYFAARFAAKEALLKALGVGWTDQFDWQDIEVTNLSSGAPQITLRGNVRDLARSLSAETFYVSLSHTTHLAMAQVVAERGADKLTGLTT